MMQNKRRENREKKKQGKKSGFEPTLACITCTTSTCTNNGAEKVKNGFLLFHLVAFIVHALIFCPCFSQKQSAKRSKNTGND